MKRKVIVLNALTCFLLLSACNAEKKEEKLNILDSIHQEAMKTANEVLVLMKEATNEKYYEGLKRFEENGKYGFLDTLGNVVIKPQFDGVGCFNEGLVSVTIDDKKGFIDRTGKYVVKPQYDYCNYFSQGVALVAKNGKWGFIDKTGEEVIRLEYDRAEDFWDANGFAAVSKDGKWGLIDIKGRIVIPIEHEHASSTQNGVAVVFPFDKDIICYNVYNDGTIIMEK